jgi:hypothetical protein
VYGREIKIETKTGRKEKEKPRTKKKKAKTEEDKHNGKTIRTQTYTMNTTKYNQRQRQHKERYQQKTQVQIQTSGVAWFFFHHPLFGAWHPSIPKRDELRDQQQQTASTDKHKNDTQTRKSVFSFEDWERPLFNSLGSVLGTFSAHACTHFPFGCFAFCYTERDKRTRTTATKKSHLCFAISQGDTTIGEVLEKIPKKSFFG